MLVQGSLGEQSYSVGSASLPVLDIDQAGLEAVLDRLGLEVLDWVTTVRCSTHYFTALSRKH